MKLSHCAFRKINLQKYCKKYKLRSINFQISFLRIQIQFQFNRFQLSAQKAIEIKLIVNAEILQNINSVRWPSTLHLGWPCENILLLHKNIWTEYTLATELHNLFKKLHDFCIFKN